MIAKPALIAAATLALAAPAAAQPPSEPIKLTLGYDGRLDLIKVLDMRFDQQINPTSFTAAAQLRSWGVLAAFKRFDIKAQSSGAIDQAGPKAEQFAYENHDGKRDRKVKVNWRADDVAMVSQPPFGDLGDPPASREQRLAAADPLTQLMRVTLSNPEIPCAGSPRFFDGKQLYELQFSNGRTTSPDDGQRALGVTRTMRCTVRYVEIAGFKKKPPSKRNGGLKSPITVVFGEFGTGGPWALADVRADTPIGPAAITLRRAQVQRGQSQLSKLD